MGFADCLTVRECRITRKLYLVQHLHPIEKRRTAIYEINYSNSCMEKVLLEFGYSFPSIKFTKIKNEDLTFIKVITCFYRLFKDHIMSLCYIICHIIVIWFLEIFMSISLGLFA